MTTKVYSLLIALLFTVSVYGQITPVASGNWSVGATWPGTTFSARTGTITTSTVSTTVTGVGTAFDTELSVGSIIKTAAGTTIGTVASITNATTLVLNANAASTNSGISFTYQAPGASDAVSIGNGQTITVDKNASANSIAFATGNATSTLAISGTSTLNVTGAITFTASGQANMNRVLNIGTGTVTAGSILMNASTNNNQDEVIMISSGTLNVTGNLTMESTYARHHIDITGNATLNIGGNISTGAGAVGGGFSGTTTTTLNLNGTSAQTVYLLGNAGITWGTLKVNNAAGVSLVEAITATNVTIGDITANSILNDNGRQITSTGTLTLTSGKLTIGNGTATTFPAFATRNYGATGATVEFASTAAQTVATGIYPNLSFVGGVRNLTAAGTYTVNNNLSVASSASIELTAATPTTINVAGNLDYLATTLGTNAGTNLTISMSGTSGTINIGASSPLPSLTIASGATRTLLSALNVAAGRSLLVTGTLDAQANAITAAGTITVNGTLKTAYATGLNGLTPTLGAASTIEYTSGTAGQTVAGLAYANLTTSGASKILAGATTVSGNLTIGSGAHLSLGANNLTVTGLISGDATGYVVINGVGSLITPSILTSKTFPIGISTTSYSPVTIANTDGLSWNVRVVSGISYPSWFSPAAIQRTWTITPSTMPTPTSTSITFQYDESDATVIGDGWDGSANVLVNRYNSSTSRWENASASITAGGSVGGIRTVTFSSTVDFAPMAISQISMPLPVDLIGFSGKRDGNSNTLTWSTASETNNRGFAVERSVDGINYKSIGFVNTLATGGNSSTVLNYSFTDRNPNAVNYYRLRQFDFDGKVKVSSIVLLKNVNAYQLSINKIFPNPAVNNLQLWVESPVNGNITFNVVDLNGRIMKVQQANVNTGLNTINLNVSTLPAGTYMITAITEAGTIQTRFVKI